MGPFYDGLLSMPTKGLKDEKSYLAVASLAQNALKVKEDELDSVERFLRRWGRHYPAPPVDWWSRLRTKTAWEALDSPLLKAYRRQEDVTRALLYVRQVPVSRSVSFGHRYAD